MADEKLTDELLDAMYAAHREDIEPAAFVFGVEAETRAKKIGWQNYPTISPRHNNAGELEILGFKMIVDRGLPDDVVELRDSDGRVLGRIENVT